MSSEKRVTALEQSRPKPSPKRKPQDIEALAKWYAKEQCNFAQAARLVSISEDEALAKWGEDYLILMEAVEEQQLECQTYCHAQNAKLPQAATKKEEEEKLPPELQYAPPELRHDRRRQRELQKRGKRRGRTM